MFSLVLCKLRTKRRQKEGINHGGDVPLLSLYVNMIEFFVLTSLLLQILRESNTHSFKIKGNEDKS